MRPSARVRPGRRQGVSCLRGPLGTGLAFLALMGAYFPRGGAVSGRSFEPILAILLFSCALALHARQVDIKLRLDYLWAAQARGAPLLPWGGVGGGQEALGRRVGNSRRCQISPGAP